MYDIMTKFEDMNKIMEAANRGKSESQINAIRGKSDMHENATRVNHKALEKEIVEGERVDETSSEQLELVETEEVTESYFVQKSHPRSRDRWAKGLSNPEAIFVKAYCEGEPKTIACRLAGFEAANHTNKANRLLKKRRIQDAVTAFRAYALKDLNLDAADITRAFAAIAFADISDYYDEHGEILSPKDMPNPAAVQEITTIIKPDGTKTHKIKLASKIDAAKELAKAVGYYEGHEKAKRPININMSGLSVEELRKLAKMSGEDSVEVEEK